MEGTAGTGVFWVYSPGQTWLPIVKLSCSLESCFYFCFGFVLCFFFFLRGLFKLKRNFILKIFSDTLRYLGFICGIPN